MKPPPDPHKLIRTLLGLAIPIILIPIVIVTAGFLCVSTCQTPIANHADPEYRTTVDLLIKALSGIVIIYMTLAYFLIKVTLKTKSILPLLTIFLVHASLVVRHPRLFEPNSTMSALPYEMYSQIEFVRGMTYIIGITLILVSIFNFYSIPWGEFEQPVNE